MVWAELSQTHFFTEYIMNGVSEEQNEIYLEFDPTLLARSLGSLRMTAKSVKIKLTNKRQPCLTIEIELPSLSMESRQCLHDVPVRVIPRREWTEHQAPNIPEFHVQTIFSAYFTYDTYFYTTNFYVFTKNFNMQKFIKYYKIFRIQYPLYYLIGGIKLYQGQHFLFSQKYEFS